MFYLTRRYYRLPTSLADEKRIQSNLKLKTKSLSKTTGMIWAICFITFISTVWLYEGSTSPSRKQTQSYLAPYEVHQQYMEGGLRWISEKADHVGGSLIRILHENGKEQRPSHNSTLSTIGPFNMTAGSWKEYETVLKKFSTAYLPNSLSTWSKQQLHCKSHLHSEKFLSQLRIPNQIMRINEEPNIEQPIPGSLSRGGEDLDYLTFDDSLIESWIISHFRDSSVLREWQAIEHSSVKHMVWQFFGIFVEGGYFIREDMNTSKPVNEWVKSETIKVWQVKGEQINSILRAPLVIVGLHEMNSTSERPLSFLSGIMASQAGHPIFLDTIRRLVRMLEEANIWTEENISKAQSLIQPILKSEMVLKDRQKMMENMKTWEAIKTLLTLDPFVTDEFNLEKIIDQSFTDSVLSYLWARFQFNCSSLQNLQAPLQVGDILILPKQSFLP